MMNWLPLLPDFRGALRAARATEDVRDRIRKLAVLSQYRLGHLETIQLDQVLKHLSLTEAEGFSPIRLAILASSTVDHLLPSIRVGALRRKLAIIDYVGQYGQYRQELFDPTSKLRDFKPQIVLLSITAREAIASVRLTATGSEVNTVIDGIVNELRTMWRTARDLLGAMVIQQTFIDVSETLFGSYERFVPGAPAQVIATLNDRLADAALTEGVSLLDVARVSARDGLNMWFDATRWLQGKLEISPSAAPYYGELLARVIGAHRGLSKKCLVLDLDNTLWGGIIGDDGLEGIALGEGSATGEAHLALQRYVKQLSERGVILAVCSKNDPKIAEHAFENHPEMLLKRSDIALFVANWSPKPENLKQIAKQLNIGVDSLVFVDDNPVERAAVRETLPMVAVPELPDDAAQYVRCLADAGYFEAIAFTNEDQHRIEQYAANSAREALRESSGSMDDFLIGLKMSLIFGPVKTVDLARVTQLINKTNQFNPTTRRYSLDDVTTFARDERNITLQFRLVDRFGDNGLISAMLLRRNDEFFEIDTWVMSCRVFGRQLEFETMNVAVEIARTCGARELRAKYIPTLKNGVTAQLYTNLGFIPLLDGTLAEGETRWLLTLDNYVPHPTHIARRIDAP